MDRVDWKEFDYSQMESVAPLPRRKGNQGGTKHRPDYLPIIATFDTETSTIEYRGRKHSFVYVWMFYLPHIDIMITGRTIEEYEAFSCCMSKHLNAVLLVYVHNLSFDWVFMSGTYQFGRNGKADVFAVKPRKILTAKMHLFEHRCSMLLSNLSLQAYTREMGVEHQKLSGAEFDYSILRYPWTELDEKREWPYCTNDVVGLAEAVLKEIQISGKDLYHFPLTSTGFVRQDLRQAVRHIKDQLFKQIMPTFPVYQLLRCAFRGGDTHANRLTAGQVNPAGFSYDRSSSYPDVQCNHMFPISPFKAIEDLDFDSLWDRHIKYRRAFIIKCQFINLRLRYENWGFPYIPADREHTTLPKVGEGEEDPVLYDNGRVLSTPAAEVVITDVDFDIILKEYDWDAVIIIEGYEARYGYLPPAFCDVVRYYYGMKTSLKGDEEKAIYYAKNKARLNSVYGCTSQDVIKPDLVFVDEYCDWLEGLEVPNDKTYIAPCADILRDPDFKTGWSQFIFDTKMQNAWLPYQFGVWTTAWARWELHQGLWNVYNQGGTPLYCDTDSVKYLGEKVKWDDLNNRLRAESAKHEAYADDIHGERHYMGVWEFEGHASHSFERFATLGAKKYAYEELNVKEGSLTLKTTIAAVDKKKGAAELVKYFGWKALDRFAACRHGSNEFTFREAGGTALIYNDSDDIFLKIDGHELHIGRNVVITDDTYRLSLQDDYSDSLKQPEFLDLSID